MAEMAATRSPRRNRTICLPIAEGAYRQTVDDPCKFRRTLDECYRRMPELFPPNFALGSQLKDGRMSARPGLSIRRILLRDGTSYSIRPSFLTPYLTARTDEVQGPLFLRKFGGPFWALARVFGLVGTTARKAELPRHFLADEHHQPRDGQKRYIATTVAEGCCLGAEPAQTAGTADLTAAYGVFKQEARDMTPDYAPATVNTDGWKWTQAAGKALFPQVVVLLCFLHAYLKIRDRAKHLKEQFREISRRVWEAYHASDRRRLAQRLRWLGKWAREHLTGVVREEVLDLCAKRQRWSIAYAHPEGHRTSNMLDRIMRGMNRYFDAGQHLHGSREASRLHCRGWALLRNFTPWNPATTEDNAGGRSPAERFNKHRYHDCWLQNLLVSASLGGYRQTHPQNP
jgi:hypothetical protein